LSYGQMDVVQGAWAAPGVQRLLGADPRGWIIPGAARAL